MVWDTLVSDSYYYAKVRRGFLRHDVTSIDLSFHWSVINRFSDQV